MNDIKARMKSVTGTMQITKAMELVATSKLRHAKLRAERVKPYLATLEDAVAAAQAGETIILLEDVVLAQTLVIPATKNITLNLNNHTISSELPVLANYGKLNVFSGALTDAQGNDLQPGKQHSP